MRQLAKKPLRFTTRLRSGTKTDRRPRQTIGRDKTPKIAREDNHVIDKRAFVKGAMTVGFGFTATTAFGQSYPSKTIRIISPAPAGSPPDIMARIVGTAIGQAESWTVVTEDKPGGAMTIGTIEVLRQPADGYTLLTVSSPIAVAAELVPNTHFNVETDLSPVIQIGSTYNVLVVNPSLPVNSLRDFIAYLKKSPGRYTFSSGGFGTPAHLLGEMFKLETGVQTQHVPYQENGRAIEDIIYGTNTYQFITAVSVVELIKSGKLRALVVLSHERVPSLPDVPTVVEEGYPNLASEDWAGILVKSGTPASVITQLNFAMNKALQTDKVRQALANVGTRVVGGTPAAFGTLIHEQVGHWSKIIKDAHITINQ